MLYRMEKLIGMSMGATDGLIGKIEDVYFDDQRWAARYLLVNTGDWLMGRRVLISPIGVIGFDWAARTVRLRLTQQQVKDSPDFDTDKPVSRQHELAFLEHYGYPDYFSGGLLWGSTPYPVLSADVPVRDTPAATAMPHRDPHLRSLQEVAGYHLQATDEGIGHLEDFLVDDVSWAIRYVVVDTSNWWPGKHVVIPPQWIQQLDWDAKKVMVDVQRSIVQGAPEYDPAIEFSREYEAGLFSHYDRQGYWQS